MPPSIAWLLIATAALALAAAVTTLRRRNRRPGGPTGPRPARPRPPAKTARPAVKTAAPQATAPGKPGKTAAPGRPGKTGGATTTAGPAAREIWWADVPFHGAEGSKVRPCLVLSRTGATATVLKITSQDHRDRDDHIKIDSGWTNGSHHDSYLDLSDPYTISVSAFEDRAGRADDATWRVVRGRYETG